MPKLICYSSSYQLKENELKTKLLLLPVTTSCSQSPWKPTVHLPIFLPCLPDTYWLSYWRAFPSFTLTHHDNNDYLHSSLYMRLPQYIRATRHIDFLTMVCCTVSFICLVHHPRTVLSLNPSTFVLNILP